ncbi:MULTISPECIES: hypothetical protein [Advenella]|uniref:hypothetical protein n=1 Tax=Advenella TaxID=290425 RepID=UPI00145F063F|nr:MULTISPECIES: hypothetical protein [Advenella]WKU19559.1 hypothetical protein Q3V95_00485 [Advenella alkanexedens]
MKYFIGALVLSLVTTPTFANNSKYVKFALDMAHDRGYFGCDKAIKDAFSIAGGDDMRVVTDKFDDLSDSLKMTVAYGKEGDSILMEAEFRKSQGHCYSTISALTSATKSCAAYLSEMSAFKYETETLDYIWAKNAGGVNMILRPLGANCIAIFQRTAKF